MRTLVIYALTTTLVGCSSQPPTQSSCVGLNPFACIAAVDVPIEPVAYDDPSATAKPVPAVARRGDGPPRPHVERAVHRAPKPTRVAKAAPAVPLPLPSPQTNRQTTGNAAASVAARAGAADPPSTTDAPQTRTTEQQVAAASAVAERMSAPTLDASMDAMVAIVVADPDIKSVAHLAGKTIAIDDRYSESSINRVRTAMETAGAVDVQLSKGQSTAISRLVGKEVQAAVVGLVSISSADSYPELPHLQVYRIRLSPRSTGKEP